MHSKNGAIILQVKIKEHIEQVKSVYKNQSICHMSDVDDYYKKMVLFLKYKYTGGFYECKNVLG